MNSDNWSSPFLTIPPRAYINSADCTHVFLCVSFSRDSSQCFCRCFQVIQNTAIFLECIKQFKQKKWLKTDVGASVHHNHSYFSRFTVSKWISNFMQRYKDIFRPLKCMNDSENQTGLHLVSVSVKLKW